MKVSEVVFHRACELERIDLGNSCVGNVQCVVLISSAGWIPVREVRCPFASSGPQRIHILDSHHDVAFLRHSMKLGSETASIVALPSKRWVHNDGGGTERDGGIARQLQPKCWVGCPDPLANDQTWGVHGKNWKAIFFAQPAERRNILAYWIGPDHDFNTVVTQCA